MLFDNKAQKLQKVMPIVKLQQRGPARERNMGYGIEAEGNMSKLQIAGLGFFSYFCVSMLIFSVFVVLDKMGFNVRMGLYEDDDSSTTVHTSTYY